MGRKAKYDFENDKVILAKIEELARDGAQDKDIAAYLGYNETHFCEIKGKYAKLTEALKKGRSPLDFNVENSLFKKCIGYKEKVQKPMKVKEKYYDEQGRLCERERVEVVEYEETIYPEVTAQIFWLKNRKPKVWNRQPVEEDANNPVIKANKGIAIANWLKKEMESENDKDA
ncbi:MAG: hypothetical protein IKW15_00555 [Bacteroidales bacterium]|nr:hypothetical protein [Bacteroidales bacterium]